MPARGEVQFMPIPHEGLVLPAEVRVAEGSEAEPNPVREESA
jgi:hypothetical protein